MNDKFLTAEEYMQFETASETRHEFINGQLFEMAGEKDINIEIALELSIIFRSFLKEKGYAVYSRDMKVKIPYQEKYYYPDLLITNEEKKPENRYIKFMPVIIVEVVSESSHITDYADKYIDYTKIPSLEYYIIAEPETIMITVYEKGTDNVWSAHKYMQPDDIIKLAKFDIEFSLRQVYE